MGVFVSGQMVVGSTTADGFDDVCTTLSDLYDEDDDVDLLPGDHEPEAWSVTVDIKTLKRLNSKDIKRQDHIWGQCLLACIACNQCIDVGRCYRCLDIAWYMLVTRVHPAKKAEPIGGPIYVAQGTVYYMGVNVDLTWGICINDPYTLVIWAIFTITIATCP